MVSFVGGFHAGLIEMIDGTTIVLGVRASCGRRFVLLAAGIGCSAPRRGVHSMRVHQYQEMREAGDKGPRLG